MADIDDINAQHLAAMGLAEQPLGQPYALASPDRKPGTRCASILATQNGLDRCVLRPDHDGVHVRGTRRWSDEQAEPTLTSAVASAEPTRTRPEDQVLPSGDESIPDDQALLIDDIATRRQVGIERYGQGHRPFNGRNTILDAYEEALDQAVYLRSLVRAREASRDELVEVVEKVLDGDWPSDALLEQPEVMAAAVVDRLLDWATLKSASVTWALHLVDAYYRGSVIDFHGESVPEVVQARIAEWEAKRP